MKRLMMVLLALATAMAIAAPAAAKKPDNPGKPGPDEPLAGVTCSPQWWNDYESDDFTLVLDADAGDDFFCVDVLTDTAGVWTISVTPLTPDAKVRSMLIVPRDAYAPGDSCGGFSRRGWDLIQEDWILPHPDDTRFDVIPAATVNACPGDDPDDIGQFAETVEYPDGTVEVVMEPRPEQAHPLALLVFAGGLRGQVELFVDLP